MRTDDMIEDELAPLDELMSDIDSIRDRVGKEMTVPELCDYLRDLYRISTKIMAVYKALETTGHRMSVLSLPMTFWKG